MSTCLLYTSDIQDNSKYEGFYINDNEIVKTLDKYFKRGTGNGIARLLLSLIHICRSVREARTTIIQMSLIVGNSDALAEVGDVIAYQIRTRTIAVSYTHLYQSEYLGDNRVARSGIEMVAQLG